MITLLALGLLVVASPVGAAPIGATLITASFTNEAQEDVREGTWTATPSDSRAGMLDLSLQIGRHSNMGHQIARSELNGLEDPQVESTTRVPVQFQLARDAGTLAFEGTFKNGRGAGDFRFQPNADYLRRLRAMGVEAGARHEGDELISLAILDVSIPFIRSMRDIGYDVPLEKYIAFRIFEVDPAYVREMSSVGFAHLSADKLVETKIHGATPEYIRQMRRAGNDLTLDQYVESRIFQITPEFAAEMGRAGYPGLHRETLVQFKIHGVTPEFIHDMERLGYTHLSANKLVEMRIHGVTPEFVHQVDAAGYHHVPVDKLIQMRIFNIDPKMIRALDDGKGKDHDEDQGGD